MVPLPGAATIACGRRVRWGAYHLETMRCIAFATLLHCCHADGGTIMGMEVNTAIMVLVIAGFIVVACLLFLLHRQCTAIKKKRRSLRLQERRRGRVADDADDGDEEECASNYTAPTEVVRLDTTTTTVLLPPSSCDPCADGSTTIVLPLMRALPSPSGRSLRGAHSHHRLRPATAEEEEEGVDEGTLKLSVRKVGSWLSRTLGELPPPGSPQFMTLRASSFVPQLRRSESGNALLQNREAGNASASAVYVRHNSRQRSQTLPTGSTAPGSGGTVPPDPFSDIPVVEEPQKVSHGQRLGDEGDVRRLVERSPSQDSQASDPFQ